MHIVAICALHQAFIDAVPEGLAEIGLDLGVAAVAELRLFCDQQLLLFLRVVGGMAGYATESTGEVRRTKEIGVLFTLCVAGKAALADGFRRRALKNKYLRFVTATLDVLRTRTVARFAAVRFYIPFELEGTAPMGRGLDGVEFIVVTCLAGIRPHVLG